MVKKDETPRFNFRNVSRKWAKQFARTQVSMAQHAVVIGADARDDLTPEEQQTLNAGRIASMDEIFKLEDERDALLIQVLEYVPMDWLVDGAPDDLSWDDVDDLDWLQADRFDELVQLAGSSRQASAKN
jgi:hypothetical protein